MTEKGKRVIIVDADPQSNLTGIVLGYKGPEELARFYMEEGRSNLKAGLQPAFESRPVPIEAVDCIALPEREGLFALAGHIGLSEYEVTLGIAQELSGSIQTLQNLPGAITDLLRKTAAKFDADYILIDMNPSLSSFNQNILMTSDYFIVPTNPDLFSVMAIDSLCTVFPNWSAWSKRAASLDILRNAVYPFPAVTPKFLGTIIQNYRPRDGSPARSFQEWIDRINEKVASRLVPTLENISMSLPLYQYQEAQMENYCLGMIADFNSLIAKAQEAQTPVFALTDKQIGLTGPPLQQVTNQRDSFRKVFAEIADRVIDLTDTDMRDHE